MALSLSPKKLGLILFKGSKMKNTLTDSKVRAKIKKDKKQKLFTMVFKIEGTTPLRVDGTPPRCCSYCAPSGRHRHA